MCKLFVSIIIPTYNRAHSIKYTLDSFLQQNYPEDKFEIIVCDNNSTDNVKEVVLDYVEKYSEKKVRYMFEGRQGVHYARNSAAKTARGDILYFTDDDMLAEPDLLKNLIPIFERNNKIGCATGKVLPKWETHPPKWISRFCINYLLSLNDLGSRTIIGAYDMGVFSCHEAIRRETFFETGGFHPEYTRDVYLGDGETGLNQDILRNKWKMAYVGKSVIYHMIPPKRMTQKHINKVMANAGIEISYVEYRKKYFDKKSLFYMYEGYFKAYLKDCKDIIVKTLLGESTLRFVVAKWHYYKARAVYDYHIVYDKRFRRMVIKNNWLD